MTNDPHATPDPLVTLLLRTAAVLWIIWGLVHVLAGVMTIAQPMPDAAAGIADAVDPALFDLDYPDAMGALINQHGFNLLWVGGFTAVAAIFVWRRSVTAVWLAIVASGLLDLGYFLFMDLGGHVHFVPGTVMTLICAAAILLSVVALLRGRKPDAGPHSGD
ncbi:MAG: hypothetical protein AAGI54_11835 [Planctomycetota bacterium]